MELDEIKSKVHNELTGLRVVRGPNWEWDTQDGGEGFVGTVVGVVGNTHKPRNVKVCWDSGEEFIYRIGAENAYDLCVLDNAIIGVKHSGEKCLECNQKDIVGLRWQCEDCPASINLCTFCFTNEKHDQSHVHFKRFDRPSSDPISVRLDSNKPKITLKGIFPGALVRRGINWEFGNEDKGFPSIGGKIVPAPISHERKPGEVWVQWQHEKDKSLFYHVVLNGNVDLKIAKAGFGGRYHPYTLPILTISESETDEKTIEVAMELPLVVGDVVKIAVGLDELREMCMNGSRRWNIYDMKRCMSTVGKVKKMDERDNNVLVTFPYCEFWLPKKAMQKLIPWLRVGSVVQVSNESHPNLVDLPDDVMKGDFGRVKYVFPDGEHEEIEFVQSGGRVVTRTPLVSQLRAQSVDTSLVEKVESIRKDLTNLLFRRWKKKRHSPSTIC